MCLFVADCLGHTQKATKKRAQISTVRGRGLDGWLTDCCCWATDFIPKARWRRVEPPSAQTVTAAVSHNGAKNDPYDAAGALSISTACVPRGARSASVLVAVSVAAVAAGPAASPPRESRLDATRYSGRTSLAPSIFGGPMAAHRLSHVVRLFAVRRMHTATPRGWLRCYTRPQQSPRSSFVPFFLGPSSPPTGAKAVQHKLASGLVRETPFSRAPHCAACTRKIAAVARALSH
jgi:hypothetical protein